MNVARSYRYDQETSDIKSHQKSDSPNVSYPSAWTKQNKILKLVTLDTKHTSAARQWQYCEQVVTYLAKPALASVAKFGEQTHREATPIRGHCLLCLQSAHLMSPGMLMICR